jgi:hypothetical protein
MRAQIMRKFPEMAMYLQPKCGEHRLGYCDESLEDWRNCPIGRKRPHKTVVYEAYKRETEKAVKRVRTRQNAPDAPQGALFDTAGYKVQRNAISDDDFIPIEELTEDDYAIIEDEQSGTAR